VDNETIVQTGVAAGDRVVTEGQIRLAPGVRVDIKSSAPSAAPRERA